MCVYGGHGKVGLARLLVKCSIQELLLTNVNSEVRNNAFLDDYSRRRSISIEYLGVKVGAGLVLNSIAL